jgi:quinohemoprotein ethanol dehydrogenase
MIKPLLVAAAFAGSALIFACGGNAGVNNAANVAHVNRPVQSSPAATVDDLATGRDLYNKHCAQCHKESGEGGPVVVDGRKMKPDNLTDERRKKLSDEKILGFMVEGIEDEGMPSFKDKMSEAEMREVLRYVREVIQKRSPAAQSTNISAK